MRFTIVFLIFFVSGFAIAQYEQVPSGSQQTSELIAKFRIIKHSENNYANLSVDFYAKNQPISVVLSDDENVTFAVANEQIVFDPKKASNIISYIDGATYEVVYKRANGEIYKSMVKMPTQMKIVSPENGAYFKKSDAVVVTWDIPSGEWAGTVFWTPTQISNGQLCKSSGKIASNYEDSMLNIPENYTKQCVGESYFGIGFSSKRIGTTFKRLAGTLEALTNVDLKINYVD